MFKYENCPRPRLLLALSVTALALLLAPAVMAYHPTTPSNCNDLIDEAYHNCSPAERRGNGYCTAHFGRDGYCNIPQGEATRFLSKDKYTPRQGTSDVAIFTSDMEYRHSVVLFCDGQSAWMAKSTNERLYKLWPLSNWVVADMVYVYGHGGRILCHN